MELKPIFALVYFLIPKRLCFNSIDLESIQNDLGNYKDIYYGNSIPSDLAWDNIVGTSYVTQLKTATRMKKIVSQSNLDGSLIILHFDQVDQIQDILRHSKLVNLVQNTWIIVETGDVKMEKVFKFARKQSVAQKMLSIQSQIFWISINNDVIQVLGNAHENPTYQHCGLLGKTCNMRLAALKARKRLDFNGQSIKVAYNGWDPFCIVLEERSNNVSGILPTGINAIAEYLNLTVDYRPFTVKDQYAKRFPNGTWIGNLADVANGIFVTSAAGYSPLLERTEIVDFSTGVGFSKRGVALKRPSPNDPTLFPFLAEYSPGAWGGAGLAYLVAWIFMTFLLYGNMAPWKKSWFASTISGCNLVVRFIMNKGNPMKFRTVSMKIGFFLLLLMAMQLFISYRSVMTGFLTVISYNLPVQSYEDILNSDMNVIVWRGSTGEARFKYAPENSVKKEIFQTKITGHPGISELGGPTKSMEVVKSGQSVYSGDLETILVLDDYPCFVTDIQGMRSKLPIVLPFAKESPFYHPFQRAIEKLKEIGTLQRIDQMFGMDFVSDKDCDPPTNALGYNSLIFPFGLFLLGLALAILLGSVEWIANKVKTCYETKSWKHQVYLMMEEESRQMWRERLEKKFNAKKNSLSLKELEKIYATILEVL